MKKFVATLISLSFITSGIAMAEDVSAAMPNAQTANAAGTPNAAVQKHHQKMKKKHRHHMRKKREQHQGQMPAAPASTTSGT